MNGRAYIIKLLRKIIKDKNIIRLKQNYSHSRILHVLKYIRKFKIAYIFCTNMRIIKNKYIFLYNLNLYKFFYCSILLEKNILFFTF